METEYPKLLASQECSTMASTWTEYLRLGKEDETRAVLEICQYEVLGQMQGDEEGNAILPPEIDPKDVVRIAKPPGAKQRGKLAQSKDMRRRIAQAIRRKQYSH